MTCSNEPITDFPTDCGTILAPGEADRTRVFNAMCGLHYTRFGEKDKEAAKSFANRFINVWESGHVRSLFTDIVECANKLLDLIEKNPKASVSAHNIRLCAGQKPKLSQRLRPKL